MEAPMGLYPLSSQPPLLTSEALLPDFRGPAWKFLIWSSRKPWEKVWRNPLSDFAFLFLLAQSNSEEDGTETLSTFTPALARNLF